MKTIEATGRTTPPVWAIKQRHLIDLMNRAAPKFVEKYTRPDGTFIWRDQWPGMDGSDDAYESYVAFPLFYVLGGSEEIHQMARRLWSTVTWQFTEYGQVHREFDAYYDWMHHGESYTYLHYLGMADPDNFVDRTRALRFAAMYIGEDPEAPNWDPVHKIIRSPINGSKGPRFEMTAEDWFTHRPCLKNYLSPYEDVPGLDGSDPNVILDWTDDKMFGRLLKLMNERMVPGDVPLNLNATSLVTNAYLYTGDEKYRQWVLDYVQAWMDRTRENGGITPDNVGPNGKIGERMNGKWWGGYYGWRWPHGGRIILESTCIACCNATLLTGDPSWLDLFRSQADLIWSLRKEENGKILIPGRHGDGGWFAYGEPGANIEYLMHAYFVGRCEEDLQRIEEQHGDRPLPQGLPGTGKSASFSINHWFEYLLGRHPDYPQKALEATYGAMQSRLDRIDGDTLDYNTWREVPDYQDVHHWQDVNPVVPEGMMQLAMGSPTAVYHGGLVHASVRYFDPVARRSGLPPDVGALVDRITPDSIHVVLVNTDILEQRDVIIQAGAFGEHQFTDAQLAQSPPTPVNANHFKVRLGPAATARIDLGLKRFTGRPTYDRPPFE